MTQRCGRRADGEACAYPAEHEVVSSSTDEIAEGLRLCDPCGMSFARRGLVAVIALPTPPSTGAESRDDR